MVSWAARGGEVAGGGGGNCLAHCLPPQKKRRKLATKNTKETKEVSWRATVVVVGERRLERKKHEVHWVGKWLLGKLDGREGW